MYRIPERPFKKRGTERRWSVTVVLCVSCFHTVIVHHYCRWKNLKWKRPLSTFPFAPHISLSSGSFDWTFSLSELFNNLLDKHFPKSLKINLPRQAMGSRTAQSCLTLDQYFQPGRGEGKGIRIVFRLRWRLFMGCGTWPLKLEKEI